MLLIYVCIIDILMRFREFSLNLCSHIEIYIFIQGNMRRQEDYIKRNITVNCTKCWKKFYKEEKILSAYRVGSCNWVCTTFSSSPHLYKHAPRAEHSVHKFHKRMKNNKKLSYYSSFRSSSTELV